MATNITAVKHKVSRSKRGELLGSKFNGCTIWFTGLSGAGKTTVSFGVEEVLAKRGVPCYGLDGDNCRTGLCKDLTFAPADRTENIRRVGETAKLFADGGIVALCSFISPYQADRDQIRKIHGEAELPFFECHVATPLKECQARDPKGLYKKAASGEIKSFTGVSSPYEAPTDPEIRVGAEGEPIKACVDAVVAFLEDAGVIPGKYPELSELYVGDEAAGKTEAASLPKLAIDKVTTQWLQCLAEGWASPLKGFMREKEFLQTLHFNAHSANNNMSVPIVCPCTAEQKAAIGDATAITLTYEGKDMAILRNPEVFDAIKEERCARQFGLHHDGHPYIDMIKAYGDYLIGGDIECLERITWGDGLDKYRKTPKELRAEFKAMGADAVFAFQLRNPVHNGHALLMTDTHQKLRAQGFKKPVLLLHPLGGWTKPDDVPLDVRMKQYDCVLNEKVLHPDETVLAIFPSPMVYAGPTEVQWHCKSRMNAGATHYIVGRDPAGMAHPIKALDKDMFLAHHGREVLQMAPGLEKIKVVPFKFAAYDSKKVSDRPGNPLGAMNFWDDARAADFVKISGSKMRKFAREGTTPPDGYMCPTGWAVVAGYYAELAAKAKAAESGEPSAKKAKTSA